MKSVNSSFWLYVLGVYILLQFLWWTWMLIDLNQQVYLLKVNYHIANSLQSQGTTDDFVQRKIAMIIGEGSVFIVLLTLGFIQVKKALKRELDAAKKQRNFLLSVTHELNSPIAGVQLNLETTLNRDLDSKTRNQLISNALQQNGRLKNLVDNILTSTRLEENVLQLNIQPTNISELLPKILVDFKSSNTTINISDFHPDIYALVDQLAFESVIKNLLENAIKYNRQDNPITVTSKIENGFVFIHIEDHGIGIPPDSKQKVFARFFRIQNEETRTTKGTGLGLYIVKQLAELMGGEIFLESKFGKGSTFTIKLKIDDK
ncbi:MAG: HAMP domain-containing sensor histidine kinase [Salibacteraceae bacterium]|nr:HAMP domain-containing sensor histidine kinase [Salibacteraceae bacterium]|tara:strand:- start:4892 stop:5845 length:954 start_codon:yes stop_codon:yes gene_type:complete